MVPDFDSLYSMLEKCAQCHRNENSLSDDIGRSRINTKFLRETISMVETMTVIFNKIHLLKNANKWEDAIKELERLRVTVKNYEELTDYEGVICQQLGAIYHRLHDFEHAVDMFCNALALSRLAKVRPITPISPEITLILIFLKNEIDEATLYGQIGMYMYCIHSYKDALQMHEHHVILSNRSKDVISLIVSYSNVGLVLLNLNQFDEAKVAIKTSIAHCQAIDDYYGAANGTARLAQCMHMTGDYISAKSLYEKCRKGCERYGDERALNLVDINIALCLHNMRQYKESKQVFQKLIESRPSLQEDPETLGFTLTYSARTSFVVKDYDTAMDDAMTATKLFDIIPAVKRTKLVKDTEKKAYDWLILSCIQLKKYMEALLYVEIYFQKLYKRTVNRPLKICFDDNELGMDTLKTAICRLNTPILAFHMIQVDTDHTYLIRWLVFPTSDCDNIRIVCRCNVFSTSMDSGNDVRQWVSRCRRSLGFGGWDWTDDSSAEIPPPEDYEDTVHNPLIHSLSSQRLVRVPRRHIITHTNNHNRLRYEQIDNIKKTTKTTGQISSMGVFIGILALMAIIPSLLMLFIGLGIGIFCWSPVLFLAFYMIPKKKSNKSHHGGLGRELGRGRGHRSPHLISPSPPSPMTENEVEIKVMRNGTDRYNKNGEVKEGMTPEINKTNSSSGCSSSSIVIDDICHELYHQLMEPLERELDEFQIGQDMILISRDILSLVPYSALMDNSGHFIIETFKLRHISSILVIWKLMERAILKAQGESINKNNTSIADSRLWQKAYLAGKSIFSSLPRLHRIDHEISQLSTLLDTSNLKYELRDGQGPSLQDVLDALKKASVLHIATHGTRKGILLRNRREGGHDSLLAPSHIYDLCDKMEDGSLRPDLVVINACVAVTESYLKDNLNSVTVALLSCGVSSVVCTICSLEDASAEEFMSHFYCSMLGITTGTDTTATPTSTSTTPITPTSTILPLDCAEALQAATLKYMHMGDNLQHPNRWAGYMYSGLRVDMNGPIL
eukprot:gene859-1671_t